MAEELEALGQGGDLRFVRRQFKACGLAEIVKHACIMDKNYFDDIENKIDAIAELDPQVMHKLVYDSVVIKADVVNRDERESGERRKLNFGHTVGHALEKTLGISHGAAVSVGMVFAAELSKQKGLLTDQAPDPFLTAALKVVAPLLDAEGSLRGETDRIGDVAGDLDVIVLAGITEGPDPIPI